MVAKRFETLTDVSSAKYRLRAERLRFRRVVNFDPYHLPCSITSGRGTIGLRKSPRGLCAPGADRVRLGPAIGD